MKELDLASKIESVLFWKAEPQSIKILAKLLEAPAEEIGVAIKQLESSLIGRGIRLAEKGNEVALVTAPEFGSIAEKLAKDEFTGELGRAGLETLATVIYRAPVPKAEIDYIRGVNSSFILRHLAIRGLVEKVGTNKYQPTFEAMSWLGITKIADLPDYEKFNSQIDDFLKSEENRKNES